jgi:membrane fusion protein, adhesin transport system
VNPQEKEITPENSTLPSARQGAGFKGTYSKRDIEFMNSLSGALLAGESSRLNVLLYVISLVMVSAFTWAYFAELDELTRGIGRTIPSQQIQVVQNLEGGIIKKIHVLEGQFVKEGDLLVTIDDTGVGSTFDESAAKINELQSKASRLRAEAGITDTLVEVEGDRNMGRLMESEKLLYLTNLRQFEKQQSVLQQQLQQREVELVDAQQDLSSFRASQGKINREIQLSRPLLNKKLLSELEFLQLEQKALEKKQEIDRAIKKIEILELQIIEAKEKIQELDETRKAEALEVLNEVSAEIDRLTFSQVAIEDRVSRTSVRSPVDGTVKQLLVNTVGGVVKPGMDILEIVPIDDNVVIETKIKPSDIAFIYPGQKAVLKFTAYDYSIYGGLDGEVVHVSADTITDDKGEEFYLVRVKSGQNHLGSEENKKQIIIGMTAQVDIITGKKTVMQYLMKPILRAKYNALRER